MFLFISIQIFEEKEIIKSGRVDDKKPTNMYGNQKQSVVKILTFYIRYFNPLLYCLFSLVYFMFYLTITNKQKVDSIVSISAFELSQISRQKCISRPSPQSKVPKSRVKTIGFGLTIKSHGPPTPPHSFYPTLQTRIARCLRVNGPGVPESCFATSKFITHQILLTSHSKSFLKYGGLYY